jgi:AcrR family transcriptional regulator
VGRPRARSWLREEQAGLAVEKILDAASAAFRELGVSATGMAEIAQYAGCSRATLYRYFKNRHELHLAYVNHSARKLSGRVASAIAGIDDPRERLIEAIVRSVSEVRASPDTAAWFSAGDSGIAARMSRGSEVIEALADGFVAQLLVPIARTQSDEDSRAERMLIARWLIRVIVSLLSMPGTDEREERALVSRFVVPSIVPSTALSTALSIVPSAEPSPARPIAKD